jgi:hypothetical protein
MMTVENGGRQSEELWGVEQAMAYLRCSRRSVSRYVNEEGLPHRRIAGKLLFRPEEVSRWVDEHGMKSEGAA